MHRSDGCGPYMVQFCRGSVRTEISHGLLFGGQSVHTGMVPYTLQNKLDIGTEHSVNSHYDHDIMTVIDIILGLPPSLFYPSRLTPAKQ
jgi:hypothetical protein